MGTCTQVTVHPTPITRSELGPILGAPGLPGAISPKWNRAMAIRGATGRTGAISPGSWFPAWCLRGLRGARGLYWPGSDVNLVACGATLPSGLSFQPGTGGNSPRRPRSPRYHLPVQRAGTSPRSPEGPRRITWQSPSPYGANQAVALGLLDTQSKGGYHTPFHAMVHYPHLLQPPPIHTFKHNIVQFRQDHAKRLCIGYSIILTMMA